MLKNIKFKKLLLFISLVFFSVTYTAKAQGTDVVILLDNSGSIDSTEWANMVTSSKLIIEGALSCNPLNKVSIVHYSDVFLNENGLIYIENGFSNDLISLTSGLVNKKMPAEYYSDYLPQTIVTLNSALNNISSPYVLSPITNLTRTPGNDLAVFLFTDAVKYSNGSKLIENSTTPFNNINNFKIQNDASFIVFSVPASSSPVEIAEIRKTSAAIASVGGGFLGEIDVNLGDPEGSQTSPRKFNSTMDFLIDPTLIDQIVTDICRSCSPTVNINSITPPAQQLCIGEVPTKIKLDIVATGTVFIKWFKNTTASYIGSTEIIGAAGDEYIPDTNLTGSYYYYAEVSDSYCDGTSQSSIVSVTVQDCSPVVCSSTLVNIPASGTFNVNGLNITSSHIGDVTEYTNGTYTLCSNGQTIDANSLLLGQASSFVMKFVFDQPVNNLAFGLAAAGTGADENFIFETNGGLTTVYSGPGQSCDARINGNEILSGANSVIGGNGGGGLFRVTSIASFTELTISGNGGLNGSIFAFCGASLVPVTPVITSITGNQTACLNDSKVLNVQATGEGTLSYKWYSNTTNTNTGGTLITGANSATYAPSTADLGTKYYYVVVTDGANQTVTSNAVQVWVRDCSPVVCDFANISIPISGTFAVDNLIVTTSYEGDVSEYIGSLPICGIGNQTPINSIYLGHYNPFTFKMVFNQPVNDLSIMLTAAGTIGELGNENFIFETNGGDVFIYSGPGQNCYSTINGNEILSGYGILNNTDGGGGGLFRISSINSFTELTIRGNGGLYGSIFAICGNSLIVDCSKPSTATGIGQETLSGITTQTKRVGWPNDIKNGWIALEAQTKGFVITRVANTASISEPKEGMLIYDESASCVKLYDGTKWGCLEQNCF